ncbi:hypothetical protein D0U02_17785 [Burkholderia pseudomallei]|uniref:Uncharacterized protein n=2 Tax=Burkholderia pseudomallei TaxID=28450 RepID=A0A0H3HP32_BURP2|nr:hypothetical protein BP1026B_I3489 [Burkholderia pseudomallei 1026b]ARK49267.1 hypothetical protein BOC35_24135 [Burkholderia pseudomallei]EIF55826.1 hypothetical protein BP1026A_4671 [Burkholderia pseudomallei 1026a]EIF62312.1 hypothetical protein BP1258A_2593 [Burkholderia pseudomallei 1258a]EIF63312.1 hypothetical protein BP1258B_2960 [Burkholderia pseudomallei 1258b]EIF75253.1 hypothetical protein BP354E_2515 [Burkholderia pseudomallei 354e]EIF79679.1 hypothetical protein BP354A_3096 [
MKFVSVDAVALVFTGFCSWPAALAHLFKAPASGESLFGIITMPLKSSRFIFGRKRKFVNIC